MSQAACVSQLFPTVLPEDKILHLLQSRSLPRHRQILLQETLLDAILGPKDEYIPRLQQWLNDQATAEPKIYSNILLRLLPPNTETPTVQNQEINNTLVIVDQINQSPQIQPRITQVLDRPEKQTENKENKENKIETINAAFSLPIEETPISSVKSLKPYKIRRLFRVPTG